MKVISAAAAVLTAGISLTACGSSVSSSSAVASNTPAAITASESTSICNDVNTWLKTAVNADMPRFNATLHADESEAAGTQLGSDLTSLDDDLQQMNSDALMNGPPGDPQPIQAVAADCADVSVTIDNP